MPLGFGVATATRVGNAIGAQQADAAAYTARVSQVVALIVAIGLALFIYFSRDLLPRIFAQDEQIVAVARSIMPFLAILHVGDAFQVSGYAVAQLSYIVS